MTATGVSFTLPDGATRTIQADTVMPTSPLDPDTSLAESLEGKVAEVYAVGDCWEPNREEE